jgi:hypothetical protein
MTQTTVRDLALEIAEIQEMAAGYPVAEKLVALRRRVQGLVPEDRAAEVVSNYRRRAKEQWLALHHHGNRCFWDDEGLFHPDDLRVMMLAADNFVSAALRALRAEEDKEAVQ